MLGEIFKYKHKCMLNVKYNKKNMTEENTKCAALINDTGVHV